MCFGPSCSVWVFGPFLGYGPTGTPGSAVTAGRLVTEFLGGGFVGEIKLTSPGGLAWNFRPHADERDGWVRSPHTCCTREKFCSGESATPIGFISGG